MLNQKRIDDEIAHLSGIKETTENQMIKLKNKIPEGSSLRAATHGKSVQYYICSNGKDRCGKYIKKRNQKIALALAQMEYNQILLNTIDDEIAELRKLKAMPKYNPYSMALEKMNPLKRELVRLPFVSDEEYCLEWVSQDYPKMGFNENAPEYYTKKGLRVRSKSEIIISEVLDEYEIPYLYEKPLSFGAEQIVHPDFTILDINNRSEIVWEHFGMMDDMEYRNNAFRKIREYESNGYYQGVNFIWTIETGKFPINAKIVNSMVRALFGKHRLK